MFFVFFCFLLLCLLLLMLFVLFFVCLFVVVFVVVVFGGVRWLASLMTRRGGGQKLNEKGLA